MRNWCSLILLFSFSLFGQNSEDVLLIGNHTTICLAGSRINRLDELPSSLSRYKAVFVFSNSTSALCPSDVDRLIAFVEEGGGLYLGAENWPLQAESNQLTKRIYLKESFGEYQADNAETYGSKGNMKLDSLDNVPAGSTTVAFPMDYRLRVEAWVDDQPLILSGVLEKGKLIIDGGYSRFYCDQRSETTDQLFVSFISFLLNED